MYVRAWAEYMENKKHGGYTLFLTLTYDDKHLPVKRSNEVQMPCFDKQAVQKFVKRVNEQIKRENAGKIKWLITSEFGEKTLRPHLHALVYFIPTRNYNATTLYKLINEKWQNGFVTGGRKGIILRDTQGVTYVTKYVVKGSKKPNYYAILTPNERLFTIKSQGFGESLIHDMDILTGNVTIEQNGKLITKQAPNYILRKVYYNIEENSHGTTSPRINEAGKARLKELMRKEYANNVKQTIKTNEIKSKQFLDEVKKKINHEVLPEDYNKTCVNIYKNILRNRQVFKGIEVKIEDYKKMNDISNLILWDSDIEVEHQTYNQLLPAYEELSIYDDLRDNYFKWQNYVRRTELQNQATRVNKQRGKTIKEQIKILNFHEYLQQNEENKPRKLEHFVNYRT